MRKSRDSPGRNRLGCWRVARMQYSRDLPGAGTVTVTGLLERTKPSNTGGWLPVPTRRLPPNVVVGMTSARLTA